VRTARSSASSSTPRSSSRRRAFPFDQT
jgi:formate dehydrogenase